MKIYLVHKVTPDAPEPYTGKVMLIITDRAEAERFCSARDCSLEIETRNLTTRLADDFARYYE